MVHHAIGCAANIIKASLGSDSWPWHDTKTTMQCMPRKKVALVAHGTQKSGFPCHRATKFHHVTVFFGPIGIFLKHPQLATPFDIGDEQLQALMQLAMIFKQAIPQTLIPDKPAAPRVEPLSLPEELHKDYNCKNHRGMASVQHKKQGTDARGNSSNNAARGCKTCNKSKHSCQYPICKCSYAPNHREGNVVLRTNHQSWHQSSLDQVSSKWVWTRHPRSKQPCQRHWDDLIHPHYQCHPDDPQPMQDLFVTINHKRVNQNTPDSLLETILLTIQVMSIATQTADVTTSKILWGTQLENADTDAETKLFNPISRKNVKTIFYQKFLHLRLERFCFQTQMQKCKLLARQNNRTTNMKKLDETTTQMTTHGLRCLGSPSEQRESRDFASFSRAPQI